MIDKGVPTAGILAHVSGEIRRPLAAVSAGVNFRRVGFPIARSPLAYWERQTGVQVQPLADALRDAVLSGDLIHADEHRSDARA